VTYYFIAHRALQHHVAVCQNVQFTSITSFSVSLYLSRRM
jgi:hypothetical protein